MALPPNLIERTLEQIIGTGVGFAISPALETAAQPIAKRLWLADRSKPTDAQLAATAAATGRVAEAWARQEAGFQGFGPDPFDAMAALALSPPALELLIELIRRGRLDPDQLGPALLRLGIEPGYHADLHALRRVHLSPADAAMARQQGFIQRDAQLAVAAIGGVEPDDADLQFELSGLPPGIGEGLELLRRHKIDPDRFRQYVREGHIKTKYEDDLLELQWAPLSAAIAAEGLIRERIQPHEAHAIAAENGIRAEDFDRWTNTLGRPPGIAEAFRIIHRKDEYRTDNAKAHAFFREVVARSDVRTEYADDLLSLQYTLPSLFQIRTLISTGALDPAVARHVLSLMGMLPELIGPVVKAAQKQPAGHHKTITLATIETIYAAGLENRAWFNDQLDRLGYDEADKAELVDLLEVRRLVSEVTHALGMIRSRYTGWKIGRDTVVAELDELLTDPEVRHRLLKLWDLEREANRPQLTVAQIGQAMHYDRFTTEQAIAAWEGLGLSHADAVTHAWIVRKGDPGVT